MKYDLGSDLHVDANAREGMVKFKENKNEGSETIVIAGDISNDPALSMLVIISAAKHYENVIFVDGNHEHYSNVASGLNITNTMDYLREASKLTANVTYLDGNNHIVIDGVMFVGANAWYDFKMQPEQYSFEMSKSRWRRNINDYTHSGFDKEPEEYAVEQADNIAKQITYAQTDSTIEKIVVVTHTIPSSKGLLVKHIPEWDMINGAFGCFAISKVFEADINTKIVHSVFGHTHYTYDFDDFGGIRFVCNPRGYPVERDISKWKPIQLET
jgi:predicted phosphodiesterase